MLKSEKTLVLYVLRLWRFVSSMSWCLESALRRCELRHSVMLKAELQRSIGVVLAGNHFVADLSTVVSRSHWSISCFLLPSTTRVVAYWYCQKKKLRALSLTPFLPPYKAIEFCSFLLWRKKKRTEGGSSSSGEDRYMRVSGINLLACILSHPSRSETVKDVLFIRRKESTCAKQESWFNKRRIDVAFSSRWTSRRHFWGCGAPSLGLGNFPSWRDFPFELTNQSAFIFTGPQAQIPSSPCQQGLSLVRG